MTKPIATIISATILLLTATLSASAVERVDSLSLKVYFRQGSTNLELDYRDNGKALDRFVTDVNRIKTNQDCQIKDISIRSSASPEGSFDHNRSISQFRGLVLKDYLQGALSLPESMFRINAVGEDWAAFREIILSRDVPDKAAILEILDRHTDYINGSPISVIGGPKKDLMDLNGGNTWWWLLDNVFPEMRSVGNTILCHFILTVESADSVGPATEPELKKPTVSESTKEDIPAQSVESAATPAPSKPEYIRRPIFALKTNLLFDLATAVNAELEVPIGKRVSVAGEWIFPDWVDRETNSYCLQANIKSVEARVWLGKRTKREVMTGHFLGAYGQWGDFDFQPFTDHGWRCYNGWAAGLSYGFAHPINRAKTLRLEYSLGVGYAFGDYCKYMVEEDGTILAAKTDWHYNTRMFPIPTKAKVSFVWMITYKQKIRQQ